MTTSLREITKDNWEDIILLEIIKEQEEFVALNAESIAGSKFNEHYVNRAVYSNEVPVGFIQYFPNYKDGKPNEIYIDQFIIDVPHQGKGYGTKAIELALDKIKLREDCKAISICYVKGHDVMKGFFERFHFSVVEQDEFDETIMVLNVA